MIDSPIAIVTGAASGIGLATVELFIEEDWRVAMIDQDADALAKAAKGFEHVMPLKGDVAAPEDVERMVGAVADRFGRIDALVNAAGASAFDRLEDTRFSQWRRVMNTHLDGVFLCSQAVVPHLKIGGGAIINVTSRSDLRSSDGAAAHGTSRAAIIQLTRQQAAELGPWGIRCNCVCPGPLNSDPGQSSLIPLKRHARAHEIAEPILFLCSNQASFVTGQALSVDGGLQAVNADLAGLSAVL